MLPKNKFQMSAEIILQIHEVLLTNVTAENIKLAVAWQLKNQQQDQLMNKYRESGHCFSLFLLKSWGYS